VVCLRLSTLCDVHTLCLNGWTDSDAIEAGELLSSFIIVPNEDLGPQEKFRS